MYMHMHMHMHMHMQSEVVDLMPVLCAFSCCGIGEEAAKFPDA